MRQVYWTVCRQCCACYYPAAAVAEEETSTEATLEEQEIAAMKEEQVLCSGPLTLHLIELNWKMLVTIYRNLSENSTKVR